MNRYNNTRLNFFILLVLISSCYTVFAQSKNDFPKIGNKMPDFTLSDVCYYHKKVVSNKDLKGKWYILDFWIMGCGPCIESFPKVNEMIKGFKGEVEIIQVGIGGKELKAFYETQRKKKNLKIPMAFDLELADRWQVKGYPRIFIVDDKGILRVVTHELDSKKLTQLINEGKDEFIAVNHKEYKRVDPNELYFLNGNGEADTSYLFRSVIAKADSNYSRIGIPDLNNPKFEQSIANIDLKRGRFQLMSYPLITLYNMAYFGQGFPPSFADLHFISNSLYREAVLYPSIKNNIPMPVLEIKDSTHFIMDYKINKELYSYSLSIPPKKASREFVMKCMQLDLEKLFGYDAKIQLREWDVWNLVVENSDLVKALATKKKERKARRENDKWSIEKGGINSFLHYIANGFYDKSFFDKTGITYEIDIEIELPKGNLEAIIANLQKVGLNLIKSKKMMKVLVIKDPII